MISPMSVLATRVDPSSEAFQANREGMLARLVEIDALLEKARAGGGEKYVARHRARGKLLPRERIELLLDRDSPFLELSPLAANGTEYEVGAAVVTGLGVVEGVECVVSASDPTVRGGATNPYTLTKTLRAMEIARRNRLPLVNLVESGGADLGRQAEIFVPGGAVFKNLTQLSAAGIPTVALVFGSSTAGGAYLPAMCDHTVMVENAARVFLGGPPLVKMATGEESDEEELGGAAMHSRVSGSSEFLARDEPDCLRRGREIVARFNWRKRGPGPSGSGDAPLHDPDELLGIPSLDLRVRFEIREVIARVVDGSRFDEWKPLYGTTLVTGWAEIHGFPVGILANNGVLFSEESNKAAQFIQLANRYDVPLLFVQNTTGYIVGKTYEQRGIIKDGARMINAVANSTVPHVTLMAGGSYGAGNYGMCGRAYDPRFLFTWPNHKTAVMGPQQLAGVLSLVSRAASRSSGKTFDEDGDAAMRRAVEDQIESESLALYSTARMWDDGIIDPRDTRTVLGLALSAVHSAEVQGTKTFGVFRM
jgi:acetyl-CoA carboxylase carboxyltransferase component